jgi:exopolyphosphatase / guanosine-5'-triphosphate,3'-diphosphate pyrophosphatase
MESAAGAFEEIAALCRAYDVQRIRAVATSAVREASNRDELLAIIEKRSGLTVQIISGKEEGWLLASGVRPDLIRDMHNLVIDVGGGSTELIHVRPNLGVGAVRSLRLGAVRLMQQEDCADRVSRREFNTLKRYIDETLEDAELPVLKRRGHAVAVAGTARALVDACHESESGVLLSRERLTEFLESLVGLTPDQMEEQFGIDRKRGQVIIPGGLILQSIMELYDLQEFTLSARGLRDGVLDELIEESLGIVTLHHAPADYVRIGEKYDFDAEHGLQVERLTLRLFDELKQLHNLDNSWREPLRAAAVLHDVGKFISYSKHHKNSHYLILNEDIPSLSPAQQQLAAVIARYHRKAAPSDSHEEFTSLSEDAQAGVMKCTAILRIADVLDRQHRQLVEIKSVKIEDNAVLLNLTADGPIALEVSAVPKKAELFEKLFGRKLQLNAPSHLLTS